MERKKFKVMEWLRRIRDEHSESIRDASWEEIREETRIGAETFKEKVKKQKDARNVSM